MSEAQQLLQVFGATLHHDPQVRGQAEAQLKSIENTPGSVSVVLELIASPDVEAPYAKQSIRLIPLSNQIASIFFKNSIRRNWKPANAEQVDMAISEQDKQAIKSKLLQTIAFTPSNISAQLVTCLSLVLDTEYPGNWPQFLPMLQEMLQSNEQHVVHAGLSSLREAVKVYQWRSKGRREPLHEIIRVVFPQILGIGQQLLAYDTTETGEMVKLICKCYFSSTLHELSSLQQEVSSITAWMTLFLQIVEKPIPINILPEDLDEREKFTWLKAKKWAMHCINRLFARYGNPALLAGAGAKYNHFAEAFVREMMPNILRTYLGQVDQAISGNTWISQRCTALCCHLLSDSIKHKATWGILKPHVDALVAQFIFPQLCIRPEDEALWTEDPVDYVNKKSDPLEDMRSPTSASITLLFDLVRDRKKATFMPILNFLNTILMRYQQSAPESRNPREKDGALCMMGCLADQMLLKTSPVRAQLEEFVMVHIYPEFTSPVAYLRARACETMSKFDHLTFSNPQHAQLITEATLNCLKDAELPVRAAAAMSLQPLLRFEHVRPVFIQHLPNIMQEFLSLTNQIDVDALSSVTDEFVEIFGEELAPYAVQICNQLCEVYYVVASDKQAEDIMAQAADYEEATIQEHLEQAVVPIITATLQHGVIGNRCCIDYGKSVSPAMWNVFSFITTAYKTHAIEFTEEFFPTISNYICFGKDTIRTNPDIIATLVEMVTLAMTSDKLGEVDRSSACTLMECMLLNLSHSLDQHLQHFIQAALHYLVGEGGTKTSAFRIRCLSTILCGMLYNTPATLQYMEEQGGTQAFFQIWFEQLKKFKGLHDTKLCVIVLCSLLEMADQQVPASVHNNWTSILSGLIEILPSYEKAASDQEHLEELRASLENDEDVENEDNEYLAFLAQKAQELNDKSDQQEGLDEDEDDDEDDDELYVNEEDEGLQLGMFESPLDEFDAYAKVEHTLKGLETHRPAIYNAVISQLTELQREAVTHAFEMAATSRAEAANAAS
ncbi:armadillo-type protein [Syncephalis plumigaleata]|nr:armadillo-type protein [Syncephalis plumigaleata]